MLRDNKGRVFYNVVKLERKIEVVENDFKNHKNSSQLELLSDYAVQITEKSNVYFPDISNQAIDQANKVYSE